MEIVQWVRRAGSPPLAVASLALIAALSGCSNKAEEAKQRYEMIRRHGTLADACRTARTVADAHLEGGNEREYQVWTVTASIQCQSAELRGGNLPADDGAQRNIIDQVDRDIRNGQEAR